MELEVAPMVPDEAVDGGEDGHGFLGHHLGGERVHGLPAYTVLYATSGVRIIPRTNRMKDPEVVISRANIP
jgi:hypothetical protein